MAKGLEGIKVGDVIRCSKRFGSANELFTVERLTKTTAVCVNGASFRLDSGLMIGTRDSRGWSSRYGYKATQEEITQITLANRIARANELLKHVNVTAENLPAVEALLGLTA